MQNTLSNTVRFTGVGLHSGKPANMIVRPAAVDTGIRFIRTDVSPHVEFPALYDHVLQSPLCTRLEGESGATVSTIEHIMAALAGCGIHNALVELDGPEVPIMDGSAALFVRGFLDAGIAMQDAPLRLLRVLRPVEVRIEDRLARLEPHDMMQIDFEIVFDDAAIGHQEKRLSLANGNFVHELCDSRTFCRQSDVEAMRAQGLALGGTYKNAVVVDGDRVLSPGGLRYADEAVRHKMLDALGDLALAGAPILGRYVGRKSGHSLTNELLRTFMADPANYEWVLCDDNMRAHLPGAGISMQDLHAVA